MPRRGSPERRVPDPDPLYGSRLISRFVNSMMRGGKKSVSERILYGSLERIAERTNDNPLDVFERALRNTMPVLEVRGRRVGGATYQVPVEVRADRRVALGIRWLIQFARARTGRSMQEKLAAEIIDAANGVGGAVRRKEEMHRMAEANKAFSHYRW